MSRDTPLCAGCCFCFAPAASPAVAVGVGATPVVAAVGVGASSQLGGCCCGGGGGGGAAGVTPGGGGGGGGGGCCGQAAAFLRQWFWFFVIGLIVLIVVGFILLIVGIVNIATGKDSTTGEEFISRNAIYGDNAKTEIASGSGTVTVGTNATAASAAGVSATSSYKLSGVAKTWSDAYITANIPTATFPATGNVDFTLTLSYTCSACTGTAATVAPAIPFTSTSFPVSNGTGWFLNRACVVVYRTHQNSEWILDPDQASCFYPFDKDSNKYSQTPSSSVELIVRSKYDFGYFWLEEQSEGTLDMPDKKIFLVDPNTPMFLGAGAALLVIGIIGLCIMCCCFRTAVEQTMA